MKKLQWKEEDAGEIFEQYKVHTEWKTMPMCFSIGAFEYLTHIGVPKDAAEKFGEEIIDQWNGEAIEKNQDAIQEIVFKNKETKCQKK